MRQAQPAEGRHPAFWLLLLGIVMMLGSCVPFGTAVQNALAARLVAELPLEPGRPVEAGPFEVDPDGLLLVAVDLTLDTDALPQVERGSDPRPYRFPFEYSVLRADGAPVYQERAALDGETGLQTTGGSVRSGGRLLTETEVSFEKFSAPPDGRVWLRAELSADELGAAVTRHPRLLLYDRVSRHTPQVLGGLALLAVGTLMAVVAAIVLLARQLPPAPAPAAGVAPDERNWALFCHLSAFAGYLVPFGFLLGPLVVWLIKRSEHPLVDDQGREALNFQLSILLYSIVAMLLVVLLIGIPLLIALALFHFVFTVVAAVRAGAGERYRYPFTLRLVPPAPAAEE